MLPGEVRASDGGSDGIKLTDKGIDNPLCWVAREVYGVSNPSWQMFREWLLNDSPVWFRSLYLARGESFARWISNKPVLKAIIRHWMDRRIQARPFRASCQLPTFLNRYSRAMPPAGKTIWAGRRGD